MAECEKGLSAAVDTASESEETESGSEEEEEESFEEYEESGGEEAAAPAGGEAAEPAKPADAAQVSHALVFTVNAWPVSVVRSSQRILAPYIDVQGDP